MLKGPKALLTQFGKCRSYIINFFISVKFLLKTYKSEGIDINAKDNNHRTAAESIQDFQFGFGFGFNLDDQKKIRELFKAERVVEREEQVVTRSTNKANKAK